MALSGRGRAAARVTWRVPVALPEARRLPGRIGSRRAHTRSRGTPLPTVRATLRVAIVAVEATRAGLTHGEVRELALGRLAFRTRERRANQRTMYRALVLDRRFGRGCDSSSSSRRLGDRRGFGLRCSRFVTEDAFMFNVGLHSRVLRGHVLHRSVLGRHVPRGGALPRRAGGHIGGEYRHALLLLSLRWHSRLLVLVVRVAGRATGLLHLVFNHRDDGVIGDAPFPRTVVVYDVTEPKPALLHELPRSESFQVGCRKRTVQVPQSVTEPTGGGNRTLQFALPGINPGPVSKRTPFTAPPRWPATHGTHRAPIARQPDWSIAACGAREPRPALWLPAPRPRRTSHSPRATPRPSDR